MSEEKIVDLAKWIETREIEPDDGGGGGGPGGPGGPGDDFVPTPAWCSDDALALALVKMFKGDWRYVATEDQWYRWNLTKWEREETKLVVDMARENCRSYSLKCTDKRLGRQVSSQRTIGATIGLACSDRQCAARAAQFDADDWLLNTPGGIVNLRDGSLGPHRREAYLTQMTSVAPFGECPLFEKFLDEFTLHNREYRNYLLRLGGYCLTGAIPEHILVFLYGSVGGEGKGVLVRLLCEILGDYACVAMTGMFMVTYGERHPTEFAALAGKRLVVSTETQQGQEWDEAKLKAISGGDPITARVSRGDPFTYKPKFKLVMSGNHKPKMRSADGAMRRRLHLLPCDHHPDKPDLKLEDKLRPEYGGILKLMIEGAIDWQARGPALQPPAAVVEATDRYFAEQNPVVRWFRECCAKIAIDEAGPVVASRTLYTDFKNWMIEVGERQWGEARFVDRLGKIPGLRYHRTMHHRGWLGLQLKGGREESDLLG